MNNFLSKKHNQYTIYELIVNNKKQKIFIKRIINFKIQFNNLIRRKFFHQNEGYFIYKGTGFQSFLLNFNVDLVFVNWDGVVFSIEKNFTSNKISGYHQKTKFLYIFPEGTTEQKKIKLGDNIQHQRLYKKHYKNSKYKKALKNF